MRTPSTRSAGKDASFGRFSASTKKMRTPLSRSVCARKAEQLIRNLARRSKQMAPGVSATILEGMDELLTVVRLKLPLQLRRSLACTNIIENMMGSIRRVCRNVKHWRDAAMPLRLTGAAMQEAAKGFRRLKAHKQLPALRKALAALQEQHGID